MEVGETREVDFHQYCKTCKNYKLSEEDDPCYECIGEAVRAHTRKPLHYDPKVRRTKDKE